jgi:small subunit ribosomal protein S2
MSRQRDKLSKNLSGIKNMTRLPGLMFVIDAKKERIGVSEANKLGIPIVAICDTNSDPDLISVPIAGNDDAIRSVELITRAISDSIAEARREAPVRPQEEEGEESTYSSDRGMEPAAGGEDERRRRRRPRRAGQSRKPSRPASRAEPVRAAKPVKGGEADEGATAKAETRIDRPLSPASPTVYNHNAAGAVPAAFPRNARNEGLTNVCDDDYRERRSAAAPAYWRGHDGLQKGARGNRR